ncbi:MAG: hypothetical protein OXU20_07265 [Myxococcales bacterium]|nr:hypothetical protein [Myxococcales bacterium]MDD9968804.1 hypothetical protein [Myxococcales bacterium]
MRVLVSLGIASAIGGLWACGAATPRPTVPAHAGRCHFLRIEQTESHRDVGADSVALTLVITPPGQASSRPTDPVSAKVVVRKERAVGLQAELEAQPHLLCEPEPGSLDYRVTLP